MAKVFDSHLTDNGTERKRVYIRSGNDRRLYFLAKKLAMYDLSREVPDWAKHTLYFVPLTPGKFFTAVSMRPNDIPIDFINEQTIVCQIESDKTVHGWHHADTRKDIGSMTISEINDELDSLSPYKKLLKEDEIKRQDDLLEAHAILSVAIDNINREKRLFRK